jgi:hypothetical protein
MNEIDKAMALIQRATSQFDKQLPAIEKKMFNELMLLVKQLKTNSAGRIETTVENLKLINTIKNKLNKIILNNTYLKEVASFSKAFNSIAGYQDSYFTKIGSIPNKRLLGELSKMSIDGLIDGLTGAGLDRTLSADIIDELKKAVISGSDYSDLVTQLQAIKSTPANEGLLARHSKTYARDAINDFMGQRNKLIGDDLGLEWFMYVGSNLTTTREFCEHLTKKKYVHKSEIPKILSGDIDGHHCEIYGKTGLPKGLIADTDPDNFTMYRGGWNCGHQLVPVSEKAVPDDVKKKLAENPDIKF